jgi:methionyl-tRNA formyltransferase
MLQLASSSTLLLLYLTLHDYMRTPPVPTIFIGTGVEGISTLESLSSHPTIQLKAVVTQPDKPFGRAQTLMPSPIKEKAQQLGIPVVTPKPGDDSFNTVLDTYKPDLAICISFGQFLPDSFLNALKFKCLNIHYSLLPILRGAVPVQTAILQGNTETGVTIQIMEQKMDTGPIIAQKKVTISKEETTPSLKEKLIPLGNSLLIEILDRWIDGTIRSSEQDHAKATYCYMRDISRENAEIQWNIMEPVRIERMVRALLPWPVAWTTLPDGTKLKLFKAELANIEHNEIPGTILSGKNGVFFATQTPSVALHAIEVQREGKSRMSGEEFIKGYTHCRTQTLTGH